MFLASFLLCLASSVEVRSPDGNVLAVVRIVDDDILFSVHFKGRRVINPSKMGIRTDKIVGKRPFVISSVEEFAHLSSYRIFGNKNEAIDEYNGVRFQVTENSMHSYTVEARAYNDGVGFRYLIKEEGKHVINSELTTWSVPVDSYAFFQTHLDCYEGQYTKSRVDLIPASKLIGYPVTFELPDGVFAMITESNLVNYSDSALISSVEGKFHTVFHAEPSGFAIDGPVATPWRAIIISKDLSGIAFSDLVSNLADERECPEIPNWIAPGRSTWQWLSSGNPKLEEQNEWIKNTRELGFEYYLIDDGWKDWKSDRSPWQLVKDVVENAKLQGVKCFLWAHSKDINPEFLKKVKETGVVGIKIDFIPPPTYSQIQWYEDVLQSTYSLQLMVNFHGPVKPTGRNRKWPHDITREAVHGHEWVSPQLNSTPSYIHDTILPFTRMVQGPMDFTPTVLSMDVWTCSHEVAQSIVLTSPFLCFGDHPKNYLMSDALPLIRSVPSVYNSSILLDGSKIGEVAAFARKFNEKWFIGILNGEKERDFDLRFDFLEAGSYRMLMSEDSDDGKCFVNEILVDKDTKKSVLMKKGGGFAALLEKNTDEL